MEKVRNPNPDEITALQPSDAELVRRASTGNEQACCQIVERYGAYLHRVAYGLVGNSADAEDVVQDSLAGAMASLRLFQGRSSLKTWLCAIVVRQSARIHRRRHRHLVVSLDSAGGDSGNLPGAVAPPQAPDARMDIMQALDQLSPEHREVIVLRELQGMSYDEIAQAVRVPAGTVESRIFRARQALRELLRDYRPQRSLEKDHE